MARRKRRKSRSKDEDTPKPVNRAEVKKAVEDSFQEWVEENLARGNLKATVHRMLDKDVREIVAKLMGFTKRGFSDSEWEVDHCNGRSGNSPAGDFIREKSEEAVQEWLSNQAGNLPRLPKGCAKDLRKDYEHTYYDSLRSAIRELARSNAKVDAEKLIRSVKVL